MSNSDHVGAYDAFGQLDFGPILLVKVVEDHTGSFPTAAKCVYKCLVCRAYPSLAGNIVPDASIVEGVAVSIEDPDNDDRFVYGLNFRNNHIPINTYHLAFKVGGYYLLDNQNIFMEAL